MGFSRGLRRREYEGISVVISFNPTDKVGLENQICSVLKSLFLAKQTRNR